MTISVLMSVYNKDCPSFLNLALESIWAKQTYKPNEIILIEDGYLNKDLLGIINNWKKILQNKLIIHINKENLGLTKSLNIGLKYATGDFIARMDSDDISHPLRFQNQIEFLNSHPDIDIVGGYLQEFNENNPCLNTRKYPLTPEDAFAYISKASPLAHPTVMIRKKVFDNGIQYDERYRTSQDIALWFKCLSKGYKIANIPMITLYFRRDDSIYKRRNKSKAINEFKIYMNGIFKLHGLFTYKYIYPITRLIFRLMPTSIIKWGYNSKIRKSLLH